ncbi:hypothetical protein B0A55_03584 [Friedmanniomyces simplex]|uniref:Pyruvate decarboxylase n=1 Tax=Friedmanniomyces simplex TaxID=329884 RepID=A0A4U0XKW3_9PEZI|nr:hypothetical protein B0A55_03584 [Friedmanniomyces simplex]
MTRTVPVAQYLFRRLHELNCKSIHGVPGDFFLRALDHVRPAGLNWIGNANELCAGYAADGYARAGHHVAARRSGTGPKVGALFTTYGVGELSAINAVAGSYAESISVVHLIGTPSRKAWRTASAARPLHHTLGDGRMGVYAEMAKQITCAQTKFHEHDRVAEAVQAYDETLRECVLRSKPVYVSVPVDMMEVRVSAELLERPLQISAPSNKHDTEDQLVQSIAERIRKARQPLLVVDGLSYPYDFLTEVNALANMIPTACFGSAMGAVDGSARYWMGTLSGPTEYSSSTDLVLLAGPMLSDTNTAAWTAIPPTESRILFNLDSVEMEGQVHPVQGKVVLQKLVRELSSNAPKPILMSEKKTTTAQYTSASNAADRITQDVFWSTMSSYLKPNDTILLANGTPLIGGRDMTFPSPTQVVASSIWCSIGQMLPAAQGISLAKRDSGLPGRTILFEGDGSFQVTCQALSDIIRYRLDVTIFIVNNGGYTYERWLNGMEAEYNDVPSWRYAKAASFFRAEDHQDDYPVLEKTVRTMGDLQDLLAQDGIHAGKGLKLVDVVMDAEDVPGRAKAGLRKASEALRAQP